jgi:hypothetical protein
MVALRDIYVLVCVSMNLLWYRVVMTCGFLAELVCVLYFVYLQFWYVSPLEQVLVGTPSLLAQSISDWCGTVVQGM